jgi:octaprenyl-diphosphate synthase
VSFESIKQLLAHDMSIVDSVIRTRLHSDVVLVNQVGEYIVSSGGKRLRPALVVLSANAFGYSGSHHHHLAAVVEFIHTATLLHDDVVDESELRRGRATASALFGNAASVLVGDFLYSRAFQMMVEVEDMRVMQTLADATNTIAEGEVLQLLNCHDADVDVSNYLHVIHCKTAKLFEAAMRLGAILCKASATDEDAVARYGIHLGTAFQLIDDVLDYSADELQTGKHLGDDLAEGKPTLPLIYAMQHGSVEQAAVVRGAIEDGDVGKFVEVLQIIRATGALDFTRQQALREADLACTAIAPLPDSKYKQSLLELARFAATRQF